MSNTTSELVIKVASDPIDQLKAFIVRGIVYMHEQDCPYHEEFDRNDFASTQIIGTIAEEPVLTARIRYFGDCAKLERLAVREKYRGRGFGHNLLTYMLDICRHKGFRKVYLHAQARLEKFYEEYGFKRIGQDFGFSDYEYIEMFAYLDPKADALKIGANPMIMNRPEGFWHIRGPLEAATLPEADIATTLKRR